MKTQLYTLRMFRDDMGSFTQPGCKDVEDALWHVNSARDHDGLPHIDLEELEVLFDAPEDASNKARFHRQ